MDAQQQTDAQQHIQRCEDVIRRQMDVIKQQRAEIDRLVSWIMADTRPPANKSRPRPLPSRLNGQSSVSAFRSPVRLYLATGSMVLGP